MDGNVIQTRNAKGYYTAAAYDKYGNKTSDIYYKQGTQEPVYKKYSYNYSDSTVTVTDENNKSIVYDFDPAGNLLTAKQGSNLLLSYEYDSFMRPVTYTEGKSVTTYTYDDKDRLLTETVKEGSAILSDKAYTYESNAAGLKTTETINGDTSSATITNIVQYDIMDRPVMENKAGDITNYTYDMMNNVIKEQGCRSTSSNTDIYLTRDYTCDHAGNVLSPYQRKFNLWCSQCLYLLLQKRKL